MPFVLDTSVSLAWHFEDEVSEYAERVLAMLANDVAIVPSLWNVESANGLTLAERRGRMTETQVRRAVQQCLDLSIEIRDVPLDVALGSVIDLAREQRLTAYDALYLDLAMREGLALATQDNDLIAAAGRVGVTILS
jgi:predicted nucleic acid-binding protein